MHNFPYLTSSYTNLGFLVAIRDKHYTLKKGIDGGNVVYEHGGSVLPVNNALLKSIIAFNQHYLEIPFGFIVMLTCFFFLVMMTLALNRSLHTL